MTGSSVSKAATRAATSAAPAEFAKPFVRPASAVLDAKRAAGTLRQVVRRVVPGIDAGRVMWVWNAASFNPYLAAKQLRSYGFTGAAIKVNNGASLYVSDQVAHEWHVACQANGLNWIGWGYNTATTTAEGKAQGAFVGDLASRWHLQEYWADNEIEFERAAAGTSDAFCRAFRSRAPKLRAALSSFGRPDLHAGIDWGAYRRYGFGFRPQAYAVDNAAELTPAKCVAAARNAGWSVAAIHPDVAVQADSGGHANASLLRASLRTVPTKGWGVWEYSLVKAADLKALGR